jgi:hypothetical protein
MVDRVAYAICKSIDGRNPDHVRAVYEGRPCVGGGIMLPIYKHDWENYLTQARVAIEAMREPTEAMAKAMECDIFEWTARAEEWQLQSVKEGWRAGIDEALK